MKNKNYIYFALIFLLLMLSVSAVSASEDVSEDVIGADNNEEIILEESINEDASSTKDELILE